MTRSKKILAVALVAMATGSVGASAQQIAGGQVTVKNSTVKKEGGIVNVGMDLDLSKLSVKRKGGLILTPMLVNGTDTAVMKAIEILGRDRYIYYQRNGKSATDDPGTVERRRGDGQTLSYSASLPYERWMNNSQLVMAEGACRCDKTVLGGNEPLSGVRLNGEWRLQYAYVKPEAKEVHLEAKGSAHLNFALDKYDIRPYFAQNAGELQKIRETIDRVRNDKDVTLTGIHLHGYASPDGTYKHNEQLAANRTKALRKYLTDYYSKLPASLFTTESTAEDWDSVRSYIAASDMANRDAILAIIDSDRTPDEKDRAIAGKYGKTYRDMLSGIYPAVRRTDYAVSYTVRNFSLDEARSVIKTEPQKLSLNDMYLVANSYEKGSDEYKEVFDIAARVYPNDVIANLNAANVALGNGDLASADKFLKKAGDSAEADNARGILAVKREDYAAACGYFKGASDRGLAEATANLQELTEQGY